MSTKMTLDYNVPDVTHPEVPPDKRDEKLPRFHIYEEGFEENGTLYLQMEDCEFTVSRASRGRTTLTLKIPAAVWNRIIKVGERHEVPR